MGIVVLALLAFVVMLNYGVFGERWRGTARRAARPALIVGGIGFVLGFFGPLILNPEANQGPLLGIFITGPLGFLVGLIYGVIREWLHPQSDSTAG